jgi:small-conductance mechanosensitive channel
MSLENVLQVIKQILSFPIFSIKATTVTLTSIIMFGVVMVGFVFLSRFLVKTVLTRILSRTRLDSGTRYALARIAHYLVLVIGAVIAFQIVGIDLSGLIVIFGFLSVGIGFGLQNIFNNLVSGIIILIEQTLKVGDFVDLETVAIR